MKTAPESLNNSISRRRGVIAFHRHPRSLLLDGFVRRDPRDLLPAKWAIPLGAQPQVDAVPVEGVTASGQHADGVVELEGGQADGTFSVVGGVREGHDRDGGMHRGNKVGVKGRMTSRFLQERIRLRSGGIKAAPVDAFYGIREENIRNTQEGRGKDNDYSWCVHARRSMIHRRRRSCNV